MCVLNREVSTRAGIDSSSNSLYMAVGVEIHIFVGFFFLSFFTNAIFFKHLWAKRGGAYITVKRLEEESWRNTTHFTDLGSVKDYTKGLDYFWPHLSMKVGVESLTGLGIYVFGNLP